MVATIFIVAFVLTLAGLLGLSFKMAEVSHSAYRYKKLPDWENFAFESDIWKGLIFSHKDWNRVKAYLEEKRPRIDLWDSFRIAELDYSARPVFRHSQNPNQKTLRQFFIENQMPVE